MKVFPLKHPNMTKIGHMKGGELVTMFNEHLEPISKVIVCEVPKNNEWVSSVNVFFPDTGEIKTVNGSTRVQHHRGAAIVLDYIEGA